MEEKVHLNGSFHANEWITTPVLMRILNEYLVIFNESVEIRFVGMYTLPFYNRSGHCRLFRW